METRIYNDTVDINSERVKDFWNGRATVNSLKSVLLGEKFSKDAANIRNERELSLIIDYFKNEKLNILDLGCGCARWASNLEKYCQSYTGVDFSPEFIKNNKEKFKDNNKTRFFTAALTELSPEILSGEYDFVIITGVLMYLNDSELPAFFENLRKIEPKYIYLQESVSILDGRLTLADFYSEELHENYNAIYRTEYEYDKYISEFFGNYSVEKSGLLLDETTGAREETNAAYRLLKRREYNDRK